MNGWAEGRPPGVVVNVWFWSLGPPSCWVAVVPFSILEGGAASLQEWVQIGEPAARRMLENVVPVAQRSPIWIRTNAASSPRKGRTLCRRRNASTIATTRMASIVPKVRSTAPDMPHDCGRYWA
jgi:hypothetical protein